MIDTAREERRTTHRIAVKGTVTLVTPSHAQRARIANISTAGVLALTAVTAASKLLGRSVGIELRLDGSSAEWLTLGGRVVRIEPTAVALQFEAVSDRFIRLIDEMTTASNCDQRTLSVVVVDENIERRAIMAEAFRCAGCIVVEVTTSLEAIVRLGELPFEPNFIAIADSIDGTTAGHMHTFVEREHPRSQLVVLEDSRDEPAVRVRSILSTPRRR